MAELPDYDDIPGRGTIPIRAMPKFGKGAWIGSVAADPNTISDSHRFGTPAPLLSRRSAVFQVTPVSPTAFSAGNKIRLGTQGVPYEWWAWRKLMSGEIFAVASEQFQRLPTRRMSRPRRLVKLLPTVRTFYRAQAYGEDVGPTTEPESPGMPRRLIGGYRSIFS